GGRLRAGGVRRAVAGTAGLGLLAWALLNPDRFIADRNLDRWQRTGDIDLPYLSTLSADAAPALDRLPPRLRGCVLGQIADDVLYTPDDWRSWNLGRAQARALVRTDLTPCQV